MPSVTAMSPGSRTSGMFLETMQIVEPRKFQPPPNHLLVTKIYSKVAQNALVQARPAVIHFGGFEVGQKQTLPLSVANVSTDVIRMHIIPPQTHYFDIKYTKGKKLVPGLMLDCEVEFYPDEWRYYYDCIRINCPGEENLVIPIHAYPVMVTDDFPDHVDFPAVPVGHSRTKCIPLRCEAPIDFEFELTFAQPHPSFSVNPLSGIVPANGEAQIEVTFAPTEFQTAHMKLLLIISQFNTKPLMCTFTGTSSPGLLKELTESSKSPYSVGSEILDPRCLSPLDRARKNRSKRKKPSPPGGVQAQEIQYAGLKFPAQLNCPHSVGQVLMQEEGKLRGKDLRQAIASKKTAGSSTRQMKETVFEQAVRQNVYEERQNQLRWQIKLGDEPITGISRQELLDAREMACFEYKYTKKEDPVPEKEYLRTSSHRTFKRTVRESTQLACEGVKFDTYTNDTWAVRHAALSRFTQAARKIIIRKRAIDKLRSLTKVVSDWRQKKYALKVTGEEAEKMEEEDESDEMFVEGLVVSKDDIKSPQFPTYSAPDIKDDMAPDALGVVPFIPTDVVVKRKVPYFSLKVPQQYQLLGYKCHGVHDSSRGYVPAKSIRPLRTGAEDEVISLPGPVSAPTKSLLAESSDDEMIEEGDVEVVELSGNEAELLGLGPSPAAQPMTLTPPVTIFKPIKYPALHIFNPAPGLQVFQTPIPYAEVDPDFHLCPIPRYTRKDHATNPHASTQRKFLDREDVTRGIMSWKKFPSQGLMSLGSTPTLTSVWIPRWNDPFNEDLLPQDVPPLLDGLPADDQENILDEEEDSSDVREVIGLMPEMVSAQFNIPEETVISEEKPSSATFPYGHHLPSTNIPVSSQGPISREKREQELEYFMNRRYNRLGAKISAKTETLDDLNTNKDLVLK